MGHPELARASVGHLAKRPCGLVERRADPKDRRVKRLHLTEKAKPVLDEIHSWRDELREEVTAGISDAALKSQVDTLLRMKANLVQSPMFAQAV
jgi:DNA-binding MarR family transcriptional regulator